MLLLLEITLYSSVVKVFFKNISYLVFPDLCLACLEEAALDKQLFCIKCIYHLPESDMHMNLENAFTERLIGIEGVKTGAARYTFYEGGAIGEIIHKIKYQGRKDIAKVLGEKFGRELIKSCHYQNIDFLVPVPLHRQRSRKRGFNQSEELCRGLSESMDVPIESENLLRIRYTKTQTKLSKAERQKNLKEAFKINNYKALEGKHVLLVDDVLTTGATIEECCRELRKIRDITISVITLAIRAYQ